MNRKCQNPQPTKAFLSRMKGDGCSNEPNAGCKRKKMSGTKCFNNNSNLESQTCLQKRTDVKQKVRRKFRKEMHNMPQPDKTQVKIRVL